MEYMEKIKKILCKELEELAEKKNFSGADLEMVWKLSDTIKNIDKIKILEEDKDYSEERRDRAYMNGSSYNDDMMYSERRGRGRNARRDSMGRYSSDMGSSYDDYSEEGRSYRGGNYSRDDAKDHMMSKLGAMMEGADPNEREILKDTMRRLEKI